MEHMTEAALLFNTKGELVYYNKKAENYFEISKNPNTPEIFTLVDKMTSENVYYDEIKSESKGKEFNRSGRLLRFGQTFYIFETIEYETEETSIFEQIHSKEFAAIISTINDGIYISDGKGFTLYVNDQYSTMTGIKKEEVEGKHITELVFENYFDSSVTLEVLINQRKQSVLQKTKERESTWLVTGNPFFNSNGKITMVINSVYDMTELNQLKEALKKQEKISNDQKEELERLRARILDVPYLIGDTPLMRTAKGIISRVANVDSSVLITGETGSGKNLAAKAIYDLNTKRTGPFIEVNCGAIPESLIESELFGYAAGAFTGASKKGKAGLIESADKGIIFLDEISEIPMHLQVKLLTFLQEKKIRRVGEVDFRSIDARVVAASNKNLEQLVDQKLFREDLYYRLAVVPIHIPPLRDLKEDIKHLIEHYLLKYNNHYQRAVAFSNEAYFYLENYSWPGNVRELQHLVEQMVVLTDTEWVTSEHLPTHIKQYYFQNISQYGGLQELVDNVERDVIQKKWNELQNKNLVAESLNIHRTTLMRKMKKLNISTD